MRAMNNGHPEDIPDDVAVLEHLTGPSRGTVTWLSVAELDLFVDPNRFIHALVPRSGMERENLVARLHRVDGGYDIEAVGNLPLWVNGKSVSAHRLEQGDMVEFGAKGPLSRFLLYYENQPIRPAIADVLRDAFAYLQVSHRPLVPRVLVALGQVIRRLARETTILFRVGVMIALVTLSTLVYQQYRENVLLQHKIEYGTSQLESFASALTRARKEALAPSDLETLRRELSGQVLSHEERLAELERQSGAAARMIAQSSPSVAFLQGAYGYKEKSNGRMLRHKIDKQGKLLVTPRGQVLLTLEGDGPIAERPFTGTGFAIENKGLLVTNRHVALPWESDANIKAFAEQGLEPIMIKFIFYLPGEPKAHPVKLFRASDDADLALIRFEGAQGLLMGLKLADALPAPGDEVIVMGYPAGLRSMLARTGEAFVRELQESKTTGFWSIAARLAELGRITPLASRGIVGQVTSETIVYDAETTYGGSGGPVLNSKGAVIAVNSAILTNFGGSNFGVPTTKVIELLASDG